jgi:hypothetical protein
MASHDLADATLVLTDSLSSKPPLQDEEDEAEAERQEDLEEVSEEQRLLREKEEKRRDAFHYDASTRRLFVRKDFNKAALLEFLRTRSRPDHDYVVEAPPGAYPPTTMPPLATTTTTPSAASSPPLSPRRHLVGHN